MKLTAIAAALIVPLAAGACSKTKNTATSDRSVSSPVAENPALPVNIWEAKGFTRQQIRAAELARLSPACLGKRLMTEANPDAYFANCRHQVRDNYRIKEYIDRFVPSRTNDQRIDACLRHEPEGPGSQGPPEARGFETAIRAVCAHDMEDLDIQSRKYKERVALEKKALENPERTKE